MAQGDRFDPGYFGERQNGDQNIKTSPQGSRKKFRKPGLDWGTFVWPILFLVTHIIVSSLAMGVWMIIKSIMDPSFAYELQIVTQSMNTIGLQELLMRDILPLTIAYSIVQIIIYGIFLMVKQKKEKYYVLYRSGRVGDWASGISMMFTTLGIAMLWLSLLNYLARRVGFVEDIVREYEDLTESAFSMGDTHPIILILALSVLVPIAEELLFRGIIMAEMRRVMSPWLAIVANALLFAIFHMQLVQSVYVIIAGLALAAAYVWSESLVLPIAMHMVYNFFGGVFGQLVVLEGNAIIAYNIVMISVSIIGLILAFVMYKKRRLPYKKPIPYALEGVPGVDPMTHGDQ